MTLNHRQFIVKAIRRTPSLAIPVAAAFHLLITVGVFSFGRLELAPQQFDRDGIGHFALDSFVFRRQAEGLVSGILNKGIVSWLFEPAELHVKCYSLCLALFHPLGENILAIEPLNLFYYLAILVLVFRLTKKVSGERAAWLAASMIALWPSFLLHSTQYLRDPLFIAAMLALILILTNLIMNSYKFMDGLVVGGLGAVVSATLWMTRSEMWLLFRSVIYFAAALMAIRLLRERKLLVGNLVAIALVSVVATVSLPGAQNLQRRSGVTLGIRLRDVGELPMWARIAARRHGFVSEYSEQSGSIIDGDVEFSSQADVIRYIPRAVEVGFMAPFPEMWFKSGRNVGLAGRLISGVETALMYLIELFALIFLWHRRRSLHVWLLALTAAVGVVALGLVVVNVGTLYRMRYGFLVVVIILGSAGVFQILPSRNKATEGTVH